MRIIHWSEHRVTPVFLEPQYDTEAVVVDHKLPPKTYSNTESNKCKYSIDKK